MLAFGWRAAGRALAQSWEVGELRQVAFISEEWMSTGAGRPPELRPSQDPARKEVLLISSLTTKDYRNRVVIFEMARDVNDKLTELRDVRSSGEYDEGHAEPPLLDAFVDGCRMGTMDRGTTPA